MAQRLKLLIVDDESHIRSLLKFLIDWDSFGIDICGEASCAEEALLLVDELQPNIIFSDICMDFMDGIEFSRQVKKQYPHMKIVLLSGHSEFDYAARGIEAGISAYLLKPLEEDKLIDVVNTLKKDIFQEKRKYEEFNIIKNYLHESRSFLIENNLNALLMPNADIELILKRLTYIDVSFSNSFFQIVLFSLYPFEQNAMEQENPFWLSMECNQILKELLKDITDIYLFFDFTHRNVLLSNNPDSNLLAVLEDIKTALMERLSCNFTIGIGQPFSTLKNIRQSFLSALEATHYRTALGNNQIIQYNYMGIEITDSSFHLEDEISSLITAIKAENYDEASRIIDYCVNQQISVDCSDIIPVRITVSTIVNHLSNLLVQSDLRNTDSFSYCLNVHERLFRLETVDELKNMICNLIHSIIETFSSIRNHQNVTIIQTILNYMEENYSNNQLTLSKTAQEFYLNSSYLSRLFKQKNNTTFSKYLIELRLKKAAELLLSTSLKTYEIGECVGFKDTKYFSYCFRKHYGMSTNEYRIRKNK